MAKPTAKLVRHFYCSSYLDCSLFTLTNDWGRRWQYRRALSKLKQEETIINLGPNQKEIRKFRLALPGLHGHKGTCCAGPRARQYSWGHYAAEGVRACHSLHVGTQTSRMVWEDFLFQDLDIIHVFISLGCSPQSFLCGSSSSLLDLQALACSFLFKFPSFPLSLSYSPSLSSAECHCSYISLPGGFAHTTSLGPLSHYLPERQTQCLGILGRYHFSSCPRPKAVMHISYILYVR